MPANQAKKLYRLPRQGMLKGVCAGLADYFGLPVLLVRALAVLSIFFGLFFLTVALYILLCFILDPAPESDQDDEQAPGDFLAQTDALLQSSERRLRAMERYITSERSRLDDRFHRL